MQQLNRANCVRAFVIAAAAGLCVQVSLAHAQTSAQPAAEPAAPTTAQAAGGAGDPAALNPADEPWSLRLSGRAWYVAPSGDLQLSSQNGLGSTVKLSDLNLDKPRVTPFVQLDLQADKWLLTLSGGGVSVSGVSLSPGAVQIGNTAVGAGQAVDAKFEYTTVQAMVGYKIYAYDLSNDREGDTGDTALRLHALGGIRVHDLSTKAQRPGVAGSLSEDSRTTVDLIAGLRGELQIARQFAIEVDLSAGALDSSYSWDIAAAFAYRPCTNFGVQIGYRNLGVQVKDGSGNNQFKWDGALAGLFVGAQLRF